MSVFFLARLCIKAKAAGLAHPRPVVADNNGLAGLNVVEGRRISSASTVSSSKVRNSSLVSGSSVAATSANGEAKKSKSTFASTFKTFNRKANKDKTTAVEKLGDSNREVLNVKDEYFLFHKLF